MYIYITGIPIKKKLLSNNNSIGILKPITKIMVKTTNFCWCLFFIKIEIIFIKNKINILDIKKQFAKLI